MTGLFVVLQAAALALLLARLAPGRRRQPPVGPVPEGVSGTSVSVVVPTFNEARRIGPCLAGLSRQGPLVREVIVVDSGSSDGTGDLVRQASVSDPRFRIVTDPPLPAGWVGKVWALQHGLSQASGEWVLGVDADTDPKPGMVAGAVTAARRLGYDVVSFSPRFAGMTTAEQWIQPSMLLTLVYRFGAVGAANPAPSRVMANGQCFLARRHVMLEHGGYDAARASWADDVTLARFLAHRGVRVGFLNGSRLYDVRAYHGAGHMWREWGRSFDVSDAATRTQQWLDVAFVMVVQGLPIPLLLMQASGVIGAGGPWERALLGINLGLLATRVLMLWALRGSYAHRSFGFWLSPLSDPLAALRLMVSSARRPTSWRGRRFVAGASAETSTRVR